MERKVRVLPGERGFCQTPSMLYDKKLEECGGDPRIVLGKYAMDRSQNGWQPTWDARDARK